MTTDSGPAIFTVGHSTRPIERFIELLASVGVNELWDVRTIPRSRANPQFEQQALAETLPAAGIAYRHVPALGGRRRPRHDSANDAWQNESFRGYADHMATPEFAEALDEVVKAGSRTRIALMCAEGNPFRCHRTLIADALLARGVTSYELSAPGRAKAHRMTPFAVVHDGKVTYPKAASDATPPGTA